MSGCWPYLDLGFRGPWILNDIKIIRCSLCLERSFRKLQEPQPLPGSFVYINTPYIKLIFLPLVFCY